MKIEISNKLNQCWNFVGEWMECAIWKDRHRVEVILPGDHDIEIESSSIFTGQASGYILYVSDDKETFLIIVLKQGQLWATATRTLFEVRSFFDSFSPYDSSEFHRAEGCYWAAGASPKLVVFGPDMSVLSPQELEECSQADYAKTGPKEETVSEESGPASSRRKTRSVKITVKNNFNEPFLFDGDWLEGGEWRVRPKVIEPNGGITTLELDEGFAGSVSGCCWFVSKLSKQHYLSMSFGNKPMSAFSFSAWGGQAPFDLPKAKSSSSLSSEMLTWKIESSGSSSRLRVAVEIPSFLTKYDPREFSATPRTPPPAEASTESRAIVAVADESSQNMDSMVTDLMNSTRPKNALVGLGSGLKYIGGGIVAGTAALVSAPVIGAKEEGGIGLLKGVAKGVGGFVGLTVAGAAVGVTQVVRGIANTPEAFTKGVKKDYKWDKTKGEWIKDVYVLRDLVEDAEREEALSDDEERSQRKPTGQVKETELYEVLGVGPQATTQDIKKAYYKKAVVVHPDKNRDNPDAHKQFQKLSQAYQVLSDPDSRGRYDAQGSESLDGSKNAHEMIDPRMFFGALFGSLKFEPYVGELSLAGLAKQMIRQGAQSAASNGNGLPPTGAAEKRRQRRRKIFCAKNLKIRLEEYVTDREEAKFIAHAYLEAVNLARTSFGLHMLRTLGWVYTYRAEKFLADERGHVVSKKWASWKSTGRNYSNMASVASNVTKAFVAVNRMTAEAEDNARNQMEASLPVLVETAWSMCQVDIEETVKAATKMVLKDVGEAWQIRIRRASAVQILGRVFEEVGLVLSGEPAGPDATVDQVVKQLEQAFVASLSKEDNDARPKQ